MRLLILSLFVLQSVINALTCSEEAFCKPSQPPVDCSILSNEQCKEYAANSICAYTEPNINITYECVDNPAIAACEDIIDSESCSSSGCGFKQAESTCEAISTFTCTQDDATLTCGTGCNQIGEITCEANQYCESIPAGESCATRDGCSEDFSCIAIENTATECEGLDEESCVKAGCIFDEEFCYVPACESDTETGKCLGNERFCQQVSICYTPQDVCQNHDSKQCIENKLCNPINFACEPDLSACELDATCSLPQCEFIEVNPAECFSNTTCAQYTLESECTSRCLWQEKPAESNEEEEVGFECYAGQQNNVCNDLNTRDECNTVGCVWQVTADCVSSAKIIASISLLISTLLLSIML